MSMGMAAGVYLSPRWVRANGKESCQDLSDSFGKIQVQIAARRIFVAVGRHVLEMVRAFARREAERL